MYIHNYQIQEILIEWKNEAKIKGFIVWKYNRKDKILNIYTHRPGPMIGRMGSTVAKYTDMLRKYDKDIHINFEETDGIV